MTYMVLETHLSYCVVLDEAGRFLKVANKGYEIGQLLKKVIPFDLPAKKPAAWQLVSAVAGVAACVMLAFFLHLNRIAMTPFASIYLSINPEIRMDVNRQNEVVNLEGMNEDGNTLIEGYTFRRKPSAQVSNELVDRAIDLGYLSDGDTVTIDIDSTDDAWFTDTGIALRQNLNEHLAERMSVTIEIKRYDENAAPVFQERPTPRPTPEPTPPPTPSPTPTPVVTPQPAPRVTPRPQRTADDNDSGYSSGGSNDSGYGSGGSSNNDSGYGSGSGSNDSGYSSGSNNSGYGSGSNDSGYGGGDDDDD